MIKIFTIMMVIVPILVVSIIVLAVLVSRHKKQIKKVSCPACGCTQIATLKRTGNYGNVVENICQNCGNSWELSRTI